jgi:hypothetical protein
MSTGRHPLPSKTVGGFWQNGEATAHIDNLMIDSRDPAGGCHGSIGVSNPDTSALPYRVAAKRYFPFKPISAGAAYASQA